MLPGGRDGRMTTEGDGPYRFDWSGLVPKVVHPMKVEIVEALAWIGRPLSARDLCDVFDGEYGLSLIAYHVNTLTAVGVLEPVRHRPVRGARETFHYFKEQA